MKKDFDTLKSTFKNSLYTWDYFVNWQTVFSHINEVEVVLNTLNYLLGKEDLKKEFSFLLQRHPEIIKAFPVLLAKRVNSEGLEILDFENDTFESFSFNEVNPDPDKYFHFLEQSGLIKLFARDKVKNLVDYVLGAEVGLDTHGRKNRIGKIMEETVQVYVSELCNRLDLDFISQARPAAIKKRWGIDVEIQKSTRSFDFAVFNRKTNKLKLFEVNFYSGGGSKLKAVCGEFQGLSDELKRQGFDLVWITDGQGWKTTLSFLEEAYTHNDYIFNLQMLKDGVLDELDW